MLKKRKVLQTTVGHAKDFFAKYSPETKLTREMLEKLRQEAFAKRIEQVINESR